jgi:diguanylate cyclase (GGDEF)-like protein
MRTSLAVMLCSIDNLGVINESYGFDVADQVISLVAQRLKTRLRGGDAIGRFSGNKIGLVVLNCSEAEMATAAERFVDATRDEIVATDQGPVSATISIGGVLAPRFARDAAEAVARAQEALDQVRNGKRSIFNAYQPSPERVSERRRNLALADEIVRSLNDRRIRLAYQPIVNAKDRSIAFHECLVRLESPNGEIASAAHIVPVAEKLGLIRLLDVRVWELAARDLFECADARVSINVSTRTTADPAWLRNMAAMLNAHPGVAERLVVEITESAAIHDVAETRRLVETLQGCGAKVAIDDFGAGFTSFRALKSLGVDLIKIDGAFVENALTTPTDKAFVMALADLAKSLGAQTVAEWVGDEATAVELAHWGIDYLQGCHTGSAFIDRPWQTTTTLDEATQRRLSLR